ncbi:MAG: VCBS repeat-containing protein [Deltaproteobacteria bacterium]|nr:VCBS repeat-containing protein [Deltaproteobacteria bacterium]
MIRWTSALLVLTVACNGGTGSPTQGDPLTRADLGLTFIDGADPAPIDAGRDAGAADTAGISVRGERFAAEKTRFAVPLGGPSDTGFYRLQWSPYWVLRDMNADGKPDLVRAAEFSGSQPKQVFGFGQKPHWKVHFATATGFDPVANAWLVPELDAPTATGFHRTQDPLARHTLDDLDGDGRDDLVICSSLANGSTGEAFGGTERFWKFYRNTASGFAALPKSWPIPDGGHKELGFYRFRHALGRWDLIDLDGDGRKDLVVASPDAGTDAGIVWGFGIQPHWRLYRNTGSGFATSFTSYAVPAGGDSNAGYAATSGTTWRLIDLDADGQLDLVSFRPTAASPVYGYGAAPHWRVYRGTSSGFSGLPLQWSVPSKVGYTGEGLTTATSSRWRLLDLDGDGRLDLVVSRNAISDAEQVFGFGKDPHWQIYPNTGNGFSNAPQSWPVGQLGYSDRGLNYISAATWDVFDIDGDGRDDLIFTSPDIDKAPRRVYGIDAKTPHWWVYLNVPQNAGTNTSP